MAETRPLILIGGGGHCKSCIDVIESAGGWTILGILEKEFREGQTVLQYPILGTDGDLGEWVDRDCYFLVTVGQIKSSLVRRNLFEALLKRSAKLAIIVSPLARVSPYANIGAGTIVHHGCHVGPGAALGENCILNTGSNLEHDARIGNHTHISTGALINGNVTVGNGCFVGSGSVVANGINIGHDVVIGAGSLVLGDIPLPGTYMGIRKRQK